MMIQVVRGYSCTAWSCAMCEANQNRAARRWPASGGGPYHHVLQPETDAETEPDDQQHREAALPGELARGRPVLVLKMPDRSDIHPSTYAGSM